MDLASIFSETFSFFRSLPISYEIMTRCWNAEPKERPTFAEIYEQLHNMLMNNEVNKRNINSFCEESGFIAN